MTSDIFARLVVGDILIRRSTGKRYVVTNTYHADGTFYVTVRLVKNDKPFGRIYSANPVDFDKA